MAAVIMQCASHSMDKGRILLSYEDGSFYLDRARDADFQKYVSGVASELFGGTFLLNISTQEKASSQRKPSYDQDRSREKEALENPVIQKAVSMFGARIEDVKPDK